MKIKFRFIGGLPAQLTTKRGSFVLEVEKEEYERIRTFPYPRYMSGTVIESNLAVRPVGESCNNFCNPFFEMQQTGFPLFVRIWE